MTEKTLPPQPSPPNPRFRFVDGAFDLAKAEEKVIEYWEKSDIFGKTLEQTKDGEPYTFYDGPPFATGLPHYGHILASTIKDLIPRYQTMKGRFVRRRWGWDCHGLPIEEIVERKLGISGKKQIEEIGVGKFNETCRAQVLTFAEEWGKMVRRIGRWIDFDNSYKTMDRDYMESVWWAFKQLYEKKLVYEGRKVLMYCPRCETPVSNFEVAMDNSYKDVAEEAVTVKFRVKPGQKIGKWEVPENTFILAWTTTPWTLPGNVALAVGKDIDYARVKITRGTHAGTTYILAVRGMADALSGIAPTGLPAGPSDQPLNDTGGWLEVSKIKGADLIGLSYEPLFGVAGIADSGKAHKVYAADFVTTDEGTGVVHTAVVYGEDDYNLGLKEGLPVVPLLDEKGKFNDKAPKFIRGQYLKDAEKPIKDDLEKRGLLFKRERHVHSYPHCWRCGTPLFYNAIPAWFVNVEKLKGDLLATNQKTMHWYPAHLKLGRYAKSVEAAPDWNISRNRYWGNPIPVWKCEQCGENRVVGRIRELGLERNTFIFARHGEAESNALGIVSSHPEPAPRDLTPLGIELARALGARLKTEGGVDIIYASDLLRTKHTAEIVSETLGGVPVIFDERLRENSFGVLNGKPVTEYWAMFSRAERWEKAPKGGETYRDIEKRMVAFVEGIDKKHEGKRILVVSHEDPLRVLRHHFGANAVPVNFAEEFLLDVSVRDFHRPMADDITLPCAKCGGTARRATEIFDSWIEAGSMPFAEYHYPFENEATFKARFPGQFVAEYIPQTRAWFYVMHIMGQALFGMAPVENLVTTGTILAEDGSKMSKSKNNFPDPWLVINKYGADSLRFYLMNGVVMQSEDLNFTVKDLENVHRKVAMILWNSFNYFATYAREAQWRHAPGATGQESTNVLDRWIMARTQELVNAATKRFDAYDTVRATRAMADYLENLSTWYVRRSRGRTDAAFFATLYEALRTTALVIAPVTPHLAEILYLNLAEFGGEARQSVHLESWPAARKLSKGEEEILRAMEAVREAASVGLAIRKAENIPVRQPLARCAVELKTNDVKLDDALEGVLLAELNVKQHEPRLVKEKADTVRFTPGTKYVANVYLDTAMSDDLRREGLVRSLERFVQELRKAAGLRVGEMAVLHYDTDDDDLRRAVETLDRKKTYLSDIKPGKGGTMTAEYTEGGKNASFGIERSGSS